MTTIIDILAELEKVRLAQNDLVITVEGLAPLFPALIRYAGHLAESKLATGIISLMVNITTPIMKPFNPLMAKMVVPSIGPSLKLTNAFAPIFPLFIKVSDSFWRMEVGIEKVFRGSKSQ